MSERDAEKDRWKVGAILYLCLEFFGVIAASIIFKWWVFLAAVGVVVLITGTIFAINILDTV